jgi:hypothetical protein
LWSLCDRWRRHAERIIAVGEIGAKCSRLVARLGICSWMEKAGSLRLRSGQALAR